jgi:hypothetical protein
MNPWIFEGQELTEAPAAAFGFVYKITLPDGRWYIGKKGFWSKGKARVVKKSAKGQRLLGLTDEEKDSRLKTKRTLKESDWRSYFSSGAEVQRVIAEQGKDGIKREILQITPRTGSDGKGGSGLLSYYELVWQLKEEAHLRSDSLNGMTNVRLGRNVFPAWMREEADKRWAIDPVPSA